MPFACTRMSWLVAFLFLVLPAKAQVREIPEMPAPQMPMPTVPNTSSMPGSPDVSPAPSVDLPTATEPAPAAPDTGTIAPESPSATVPGCPGGPDCPPEPEGEGPFGEAVKEMLKEFAKCETQGKSLDECLSDNPPQPHLSQLTQEDRDQLVQCLGSSDLSVTKARWAGCLVGAD